jgi:anti-anti-sigma regulatory factor
VVISDAASSGPPEKPWPPGGGPTDLPLPNLALVVGRGYGSVVVTVEGDLDFAGSQLLEGVLTDLIEGQGNLTVAVDLGKAVVEPVALVVFMEAARQARRLGTKFILKEAPSETHDALESEGYGEQIEMLPRRAPGA